MRVIFLGPPGAGKGTQAIALSDHLSVPHVASGDLFRDHISRKTALGKQAQAYLDGGHLVPDTVTIDMVLERLARSDCTNGVVLDGFPRTLEQAQALDRALTKQQLEIDLALHLHVSVDELVRRLSGRRICSDCQAPYHILSAPALRPDVCDRCGGALQHRPDDRSDAVRKRIEVYNTNTAPLVNYYNAQKKLQELDGEQSIDDLRKQLITATQPSR